MIVLGVSGQEQKIDSTKYDYIGLAIDSAFFNGKSKYINELFDVQSLEEKTIIPSKDSSMIYSNQMIRKFFFDTFDYASKIKKELGEYGSFDFLRSRVNEKGEYLLLFRASASNGVNYYDYHIGEKKGSVKILDIYNYFEGEYYSDSYSKATRMDSYNRKLLDSVYEIGWWENYLSLRNLKRSLNTSYRFGSLLKRYNGLPDRVLKQRHARLIGIQLAYRVNELEFEKATAAYEALFPNDPSLYLVSMDGLFKFKQYDRVLETINKLDKALGGDTFLDSYRANIYYFKEDFETALKYANKMRQNYPLYFNSHMIRISVLVSLKKYSEVINSLKTLYAIFDLDKQKLNRVMEATYPELIKTKEYQNFLKSQ